MSGLNGEATKYVMPKTSSIDTVKYIHRKGQQKEEKKILPSKIIVY